MKYNQTFDTISVRTPLSSVNSFKKEIFQPYETSGGVLLHQITAKTCKHPGINLIRINDVSEEAVISISAKILGKDYPQFINSDTIAQALDRVNATGFISLDTAAVLASAEPLQLHPAKDRELNEPLSHYLRLLQLLHVNNLYIVSEFDNENTITYAKKVKTRKAKEYFKLYGKLKELEMKKNQAFRDSLLPTDLASVRQYFAKKVRFELELNCMEKIHQYYKLPRDRPMLLTDVFASPINPLAEIVSRLRQDMASSPEELDEKLFLMTLSKHEVEVFGACLAFRLNIEAIKAFLAKVYTRVATARDKFRKAKELISRFQAQRNSLRNQDFALIAELSERVSMDI